ncbi:MAG: LysE family translocator [Alphaproteobacteria bacterium]|nr:LysE family translocator [Alphaproteobacteria bacterium]MCW5739588.1 LysE family translocator [Alphaproteobacteria bacterium]
MLDFASWLLFLGAALVIALSPGPGIFYVAARSLAGGRGEGLASVLGTSIGGLVHVLGGAVGVSALIMASAEAFTALKLAGAAYLVWLGIRTIREAGAPLPIDVETTGARRALRDGIIVEAFNPKTAAFFLAFIPQFIDPAGIVSLQFVVLGSIPVLLNSAVDVVVVLMASRARATLGRRASIVRRLRQGSGAVICGLGAMLALARRPA